MDINLNIKEDMELKLDNLNKTRAFSGLISESVHTYI